MWVRLADLRSEHMAYVDVLKGAGQRLWLFRPFDGTFVEDFHAEGDQLWCMGRRRKGQDEGSQIVRYDLTTGQEVARVWLEGTWANLQLFGISETIAVVGYGEVALLDASTLDLRHRFHHFWTFNAPQGLTAPLEWRSLTQTDTPIPRVIFDHVLQENPDGSIRAYWVQLAASTRRGDPAAADGEARSQVLAYGLPRTLS